MKKILYLSVAQYPSVRASAVQHIKMCEGFSKLGYDVTLVTLSGRSTDPAELYQSLKTTYNIRYDFKVTCCDKTTGLRRSLLSWALRIVRAGLRGDDLIFTRNLPAALAANFLRRNVVFEAHHAQFFALTKIKEGTEVPKSKKAINRDRWVLKGVGSGKFTRAFVVINKYLQDACLKNPNIISSKIHLAPCGTNTHSDYSSSVELRGSFRLNIGYTGGLFQGKGMEVISKLAPRCPAFGFHVIGGTEEEVSHWSRETEGQENLFFYGYKPHMEIARFLNTFDIVLLPNQHDVNRQGGGKNIGRSTSPLKCFEYMAARKTIIASNVPALAEILRHEENAYLCAPDQIEDWVQGINKIAKNRAFCSEMADRAYQDFVHNYTIDAKIKNLLLKVGGQNT